MAKNSDNLNQEYREFLSVNPSTLPQRLSTRVHQNIEASLNPNSFSIFFKLIGIHSVVATMTLLYCPQFGVTLTSGMGLMHYLAQFGDAVCMLGCGALFTGLSFFSTSLILRPEEVRALRRTKLFQVVALITLSFAVLLCFGAEVLTINAISWTVGALFASLLTLELGWRGRRLILVRQSS